MNKLYHAFYVYNRILCPNLNQTIENIALGIDVDWEYLFERYADDEKFSNMSDEEFCALTCVQLLDMLGDEALKDIAADIFYPENGYACDYSSDYKVYTINDEGKLVEVNIIEEPGFMEAFKKAIRKDAEWMDKIE